MHDSDVMDDSVVLSDDEVSDHEAYTYDCAC